MIHAYFVFRLSLFYRFKVVTENCYGCHTEIVQKDTY